MSENDAYLFDGNGGFPTLLLVQNGETDGAGRVHIRVEKGRTELA